MSQPLSERLAKIIAQRGYCSRREAEKLIICGAVQVNGLVFNTLSEKVAPDVTIQIHKTPVPIKSKTHLWGFFKPPLLICSHHDPQGRQTVFDYIREKFPQLPRVISVGRLDYLSEGLLLLTNDPSLAHYLEQPTNKIARVYEVKTQYPIEKKIIAHLQSGLSIEGVNYEPISVSPLSVKERNIWYQLVLKEGKNREIRRILKHFNIPLARLKRVSYGPYQLGSLKQGEIKELRLIES